MNVNPPFPFGYATITPSAAPPSILRTRRLDSNWDPVYGHGQADFLINIDAIAQIIATTLKLFIGEWWEALNQGTVAIWQNGSQSPNTLSILLQERILSLKPYVTGVMNVSSSFNSATRAVSFFCVAQTVFGPVTISNSPGNQATIPQ